MFVTTSVLLFIYVSATFTCYATYATAPKSVFLHPTSFTKPQVVKPFTALFTGYPPVVRKFYTTYCGLPEKFSIDMVELP
jgi:hypothetical protein